MVNLVIYRKYRPQSFAEIVGQEHVVKTLQNAVMSGFLAHAYLFAGPRGCGKTSLARILAKAINCQKRLEGQFEPCNKCESCLEINQGRAMDLIEIDAASNRGIDEIRELKEGIRFRPAKMKYKVFIIDEAHQLTKEAFNALLKTLEEPPEHAIFILATTELSKMLPTILSRVQRFEFRKLRLPEMVNRLAGILKSEKIKYDREALDLIALASGGALRDAETLLDEVVSFVGQDGKVEKKEVQILLGAADNQAIFKFLSFLQQNQAKEAVEFINQIIFESVDIKEFSKTLLQFLRELLLFKLGIDSQSGLKLSLNEAEQSQIEKIAQGLSEKRIKDIIEVFSQADEKIKHASIPQLPLELAIVEICLEKV